MLPCLVNGATKYLVRARRFAACPERFFKIPAQPPDEFGFNLPVESIGYCLRSFGKPCQLTGLSFRLTVEQPPHRRCESSKLPLHVAFLVIRRKGVPPINELPTNTSNYNVQAFQISDQQTPLDFVRRNPPSAVPNLGPSPICYVSFRRKFRKTNTLRFYYSQMFCSHTTTVYQLSRQHTTSHS